MRPERHPVRSAALLVAALVLAWGCRESSPGPGGDPDTGAAVRDTARNLAGRVYERRFVFTSANEDTALVVPFFFGARSLPGTLERSVRGWLGRDGSWNAIYEDRWQTPPSPAPFRILPRGPIRLVVGEDDAVEAIVYRERGREMELSPAATLVEWSGSRGETVRLHEGRLALGERSFDGFVLDLARARRAQDVPHGDWGLLVSGDSLQLVLLAPEDAESEGINRFQAFGRVDFREVPWPELEVEWGETRTFDPARREVPVSWSLGTTGGDLEGVLRAEASLLAVREGDGPVLPVEGLYTLTGTLRVMGSDYPVRGFFRHRQD